MDEKLVEAKIVNAFEEGHKLTRQDFDEQGINHFPHFFICDESYVKVTMICRALWILFDYTRKNNIDVMNNLNIKYNIKQLKHVPYLSCYEFDLITKACKLINKDSNKLTNSEIEFLNDFENSCSVDTETVVNANYFFYYKPNQEKVEKIKKELDNYANEAKNALINVVENLDIDFKNKLPFVYKQYLILIEEN